MRALDRAAVERAAAGVALRVPRGPHRGKVGELRSASVGSSLELHDFRLYQPGDDLRHLDWNAVARTGELVLRVRQDEVSPRLELLVDASGSMAVSEAKAARTREVAAWVSLLGARAGLEVSATVLDGTPRRIPGPEVLAALELARLDGRRTLEAALAHAPPPRPCGVRVVVSDFLFEAVPRAVVDRLARGASWLVLLQVLDAEDLEPPFGSGVRLVDAESGEALERFLTAEVVAGYRERLDAHLAQWQLAVRRVHGVWLSASSAHPLEVLARRELGGLVEGAR